MVIVMPLEYLFDGAFGTYYQSLTGSVNSPEEANISNSNIVFDIHERYIKSGANAIKTNTFGANIGIYPDMQKIELIINAGCEIAFRAAQNKNVSVFADIGPIFAPDIDLAEYYKELAEIFIKANVKNFLFETMPQSESLILVIKYIKNKIKDSVIITSFAVTQDGYSSQGEYYLKLFESVAAAGANYVGINCICGPSHMQKLIEKCDTDNFAVSAMPNAGYPSVVNGRTIYIDNPEYFSEKLLLMYKDGVKILGGCCGTTPEHIKAIKEKIDSVTIEDIKPKKNTQDVIYKNKENVFNINKKIIAVEIDPPTDTNVEYLLSASKRAKLCGADFVTIPDSPLARTKADSIMLASKIEREIRIKTIPHLSCRDKNQIAIKGQLIAGNIEGIENILAITGDPISQTERSLVKNVFGFNSYRLISFINNLNSDLFKVFPYTVYAALNINAVNFESELLRAEEKVKCGTDVFITQPIYSQEHVNCIKLARNRLSTRILTGIMPFASYKNAVFLNNEVSGINIPDDIIEKLKNSTGEETREISVSFCKNLIDEVYDYCDGYCIMTPLKKIDFTEELIKFLKNK